MKDFELKNGDVVIDDGDIKTVSDNDEIAQRIITSLQTRLEEFEISEGSWGLTRENALGKAYNEDFLRTDIIDCITNDVDKNVNVSDIEFEKDDDTRSLIITLKIYTSVGDINTVTTEIGGVY